MIDGDLARRSHSASYGELFVTEVRSGEGNGMPGPARSPGGWPPPLRTSNR